MDTSNYKGLLLKVQSALGPRAVMNPNESNDQGCKCIRYTDEYGYKYDIEENLTNPGVVTIHDLRRRTDPDIKVDLSDCIGVVVGPRNYFTIKRSVEDAIIKLREQ